jgi:hypothetical protein
MPCGCKDQHFGGASFHPDDGGGIFLQNVGSYKSHMTSNPILNLLWNCNVAYRFYKSPRETKIIQSYLAKIH